MRRKYRQLLFSCPAERLSPLSGVILQHETLQQRTDQGESFIDVVKGLGMIPGVTVDKGWVGLAGSGGKEVFTQDFPVLLEFFLSEIFHFLKLFFKIWQIRCPAWQNTDLKKFCPHFKTHSKSKIMRINYRFR